MQCACNSLVAVIKKGFPATGQHVYFSKGDVSLLLNGPLICDGVVMLKKKGSQCMSYCIYTHL